MPGMMAVFEVAPNKPPCIVRWTGRGGLSVRVETYCGGEHKVGDAGVLQIPDVLPACDDCKSAIAALAARVGAKT